MYNHIELEDVLTSYGYVANRLVIDKKALTDYLKEWTSESQDEHLKSIGKFNKPCCAWDKDIAETGDVRSVWRLIEKNSAVIPLLLYSEDSDVRDLTCTVLVADVIKTNDFVYWEKIGYCINFNHYYQGDGDVCWIKEVDWKFTKEEYENMLNVFWESQTLKQLRSVPPKKVIDVKECAYMLADLTRYGWKILDDHIEEYGEIHLHILASRLITEPLKVLAKRYPDGNRMIEIYCEAIEVMKNQGTEEVVNVVDVTVWEGLQGETDSTNKVNKFMTKLMEPRQVKIKRVWTRRILFLLICATIVFGMKRLMPIARTDFWSLEHFEQLGGECCWYEIPDGVQDMKFYLTDTLLYRHSIYAFTIEDEDQYDAFMEYIRAESCYEAAVEYPGWEWNYDGIAKYSEEELAEMSYLQQNHKSMDYTEVLERASKHKFGFACAYGADVEDFVDVEYSLGEFPIGLPFDEVISDDISDYTILNYRPMGTGSVEDGILVNQETHRFVIYYAGQIR